MKRNIILLALFCVLLFGCHKKEINKKEIDTNEVNSKEISETISNIKIDDYIIDKTSFSDSCTIIIYNPLQQSPNSQTILRVYNSKDGHLIAEEKNNGYFDEIICNKDGFYLKGKTSVSIYSYEGIKMQTIEYSQIFNEDDANNIFCISQDLKSIAYIIEDTNDLSCDSYDLYISDLSLKSRDQKMKISQKKDSDLNCITKMYFSNNNSIVFMGLTYPQMKMGSETKQCYGSIDMDNKSIKLNILDEIDILHTYNRIYIIDTMRDSYSKKSSGYVRYIDLKTMKESSVKAQKSKSSERFICLSNDIYGFLNFNAALTSEGYSLDLYKNDNYIKTVDTNSLNLTDDPQNLKFMYNEFQKKLIISYYCYDNDQFVSEVKQLDLDLK